MLKISIITLLISIGFLGCSSMQINTSKPSTIDKEAPCAIIPFYNYTQTPLAGFRAASLANAVASQKGYHCTTLGMSPKEGILDDNVQKRAIMIEKAQKEGIHYLIAGDVTEWRYKTGIDGEPAVGLVIEIIDTETSKTIYRGAASQSAWGHKSLSVLAQSILEELVH